MPTTWIPRHTGRERQSWLLATGEIVQEPHLEESGSAVKVRIAGTTKAVYKKDLEKLVKEGLAQIAQRKRTHVWMPIDVNERALRSKVGFEYPEERARFDVSAGNGVKSTAWWLFEHPALPIKALLWLRMHRTSSTELKVIGKLTYPDTRPDDSRHRTIASTVDGQFNGYAGNLTTDVGHLFEDWARSTKEAWTDDVLGFYGGLLERGAVETLLDAVLAAEDLETIEIPDLRGERIQSEHDFDRMTLRFVDSNVNGQFVNDMREYLESQPALEKARDLYEQLVITMRGLGMVLPETLRDNQFHQALAAGDEAVLTVKLGHALNDNATPDAGHQVAVHLPTGTFVVECSKTEDKDVVAHAWNEALFLAQMTGKEEEFLGYARQHAEANLGPRAKKIVTTRTKQRNT